MYLSVEESVASKSLADFSVAVSVWFVSISLTLSVGGGVALGWYVLFAEVQFGSARVVLELVFFFKHA